MGSFVRVLTIVLFSVCASITGRSQVGNLTNTTSAPVVGVGHDYIQLFHEMVNPVNGSVSLTIDLPVPQSRGITIPVKIAYNSNFGNYSNAYGDTNGNVALFAAKNWTFGVPYMTAYNTTRFYKNPQGQQFPCPLVTNFVFNDEKGAHNMGGLNYVRLPNSTGCLMLGIVQRNGSDNYIGGAYNASTHQFVVSNLDGTKYYFPLASFYQPSFPQNVGVGGFPSTIEDRNGNTSALAGSFVNSVGSQL